MANLLYGAMAGAGKAALDSMQAREQAYLEEEKQKRLLELRREQEIEMLNIQDLLNGKKIEKDLTEFGEDGVKFYNSKGDQIGARAYNPAELAAKKTKDEEAALERRLKQARIATEQAQASKYNNDIYVARARLALDRKGGGRRGKGGSDDDSSTPTMTGNVGLDTSKLATQMVYTNKEPSAHARKYGVTDNMMHAAAYKVVQEAAISKAKGVEFDPDMAYQRALDVMMRRGTKRLKPVPDSYSN